MNPIQRPDSFEVADYAGVLRRRWRIVLALTLVGLVGAFGYVTVAPKIYAATAAVFVSATGASSSAGQATGSRATGGGQVNLDTEAQIVTSGTVATIAGHILKSPLKPYKLSSEITVAVPPNSQVLNITCSTSSGQGAADCANAFANAYLQNRSADATATLNDQLKSLAAKVAALDKAISSLSAKISSLPNNSPTKINDQGTVASDRTQLHSLLTLEGSLSGASTQVSGGRILTPATAPGKPTSPKKLLILPSGLLVGLLIGLIAAFIRDRRDKRIHSADDVERSLGMPVMLALPAFGRQISLASPRSRNGQAFTELAIGVGAALGEGNHVVLVAGTTKGIGRSVVAANLAATLARTHSEVVLVCADLNGTAAPELLGVGEEGQGLAELVSGNATVRDVARGPGSLPGLWVITPGADPSLAVYNMQHDRARALISQLRRDARYVIIEAQATEEGADTFALGEFADGAIVTIEVGNTDRNDAADSIRRLRQLRTPLIGAVVTEPTRGRVSVVSPRQRMPRGGGPAEPDVTGAGQGNGAATVGIPPDRRDRPARPRDGYSDRADRVSGG
jgi:capsular polysaccharide biosynthesis protein